MGRASQANLYISSFPLYSGISMQKQKQIIVDKKGRVMLPKRLREQIEIKPGQRLVAVVQSDEIRLKKLQKATPQTDPLMWDIMHPARSKVRVTSKLLDELKDEQWSGR